MKILIKFLIIIISFNSFLFANFAVDSIQEIRSKNTIRQKYEESCGAAALATLLNLQFSENRFNEKIILENLPKTKNNILFTDIISFEDLKITAEKLGFNTKSYKLQKNILNIIKYVPILVKIQRDIRTPHFAVIININANFFKIYDPQYGEFFINKSDFYNLWDIEDGGFVLILENATKLDEEIFKYNIINKYIFYDK